MSSFDKFKRSRDDLNAKLQKSLEKTTEGSGSSAKDDDTFWKLTVDKKTGVGQAVIRFLPASEGEDVPYVQLFTHGFKSKLTGKWYIENSLTTIGKDDPVSEMNRELWNSGLESNKAIARERKRKLSYYANILVIKDPAKPENEGKVFKFRFGQKIFEMIQAQIKPQYDDIVPVNPFDFWEGANFRLRAKSILLNGQSVPTYEDSEFDRPSALFKGDDAKLEELWKQQYKLSEIVSEDKFKSYDELKAKLRAVLGAEANNFALFGGDINNAKAGIHADAAEPARQPRAADIPVDTGGEDDVPWKDEPVAAGQEQSAEDYFGSMGRGLFKD